MEIIIIFLSLSLITSIFFNIKKSKKNKELNTSILNFTNFQSEFLKSLPLPAWTKNKNGVMCWINNSYIKTYNVNYTDYVGKKDSDIWSKKISERYEKHDKMVIKNKKGYRFIENIEKDKFILVWKFPIINSFGKIIGVGGICILTNLSKPHIKFLNKKCGVLF